MNRLNLIIISGIFSNAFAYGGFYAGIGAGSASLTNTAQGNYIFVNGSAGTQISTNFASTLYFGYNFNRFIAIEANYNVAYKSQIASSYNVGQQLLGGTVLAKLPFEVFSSRLRGISVFAKGGLDYDVINFTNPVNCNKCINPPNSSFNYLPVYGAGLEYDFQNQIGIRGEWNEIGNITASNNNVSQVNVSSNMYLLSILYNF